MSFNRKLFKEAFKAGYKKAKQVIREGFAVPKDGKEYRLLFQKLYIYAKGRNLSYKVLIKDLGTFNKDKNEYTKQPKEDITVGYCTINDFRHMDRNGVKIYDENHELLADIMYYDVEEAKLVPYAETRGNVVQIKTEIDDEHKIIDDYDERKKYALLQFLPVTKDGTPRPFGTTIRALQYDKLNNGTDGVADNEYGTDEHWTYKNALDSIDNMEHEDKTKR